MARLANESIADIIDAAVVRAVAGLASRIQRELDAAAAEARRAAAPRAEHRPGRRRRTRVRPQDLTKWVAGRQARRVPKFVIVETGLDTKKKIVAKFGEGATFQKGKPLPPVVTAKAPKREEAARTVAAKPPVVRKAAAGK